MSCLVCAVLRCLQHNLCGSQSSSCTCSFAKRRSKAQTLSISTLCISTFAVLPAHYVTGDCMWCVAVGWHLHILLQLSPLQVLVLRFYELLVDTICDVLQCSKALHNLNTKARCRKAEKNLPEATSMQHFENVWNLFLFTSSVLASLLSILLSAHTFSQTCFRPKLEEGFYGPLSGDIWKADLIRPFSSHQFTHLLTFITSMVKLDGYLQMSPRSAAASSTESQSQRLRPSKV